jgi:hypothetical protein
LIGAGSRFALFDETMIDLVTGPDSTLPVLLGDDAAVSTTSTPGALYWRDYLVPDRRPAVAAAGDDRRRRNSVKFAAFNGRNQQ